MKWFAILFLVMLGLLGGLYAALPAAVAWALPAYLARFGISEVRIDLGRPDAHSIGIHALHLRREHIDVAIAGMRLHYDVGSLLAGRVLEVSMDDLTVAIGPSDAPPLLEVPPLWSLLPADRLEVTRLVLAMVSPDLRLDGRLVFDEMRAEVDATIESAQLPTPLEIGVRLARAGQMDLSLATPSNRELISLHGIPDGQGRIALAGQLDLTESPLALLGSLLGVDALQGRVAGRITGEAPWPLIAEAPLRDVALSGDLAIALAGSVAVVREFTSEGRVALSMHDATLAAVVAPGGRFTFGRLAAADVEAENLTVTLAEPLELRIDDAGRVTLGATADVLALPTVAWASSRVSFASEDTFRVVIDAHSSLAEPDLADASTATARIEASLAATCEGEALPIHWAEWNGGAELVWTAGRLTVELAEKASLTVGDLAVPIAGTQVPSVELGLLAPLAIALDTGTGDAEIGVSRIRFSAPELRVEGQRLSIRRGLVDLESATWRNGAVSAALRIATRSDKDALPAGLVLRFDPARRQGTFELAVQGPITRPLLATQLPGWKSGFDLDRGHIDFTMRGAWSRGKDGSGVDATGRIALVGARAHAGEIRLDGIDADLPLAVAPSGVIAGPARMTVTEIDAGIVLRALTGTIELTPSILSMRDAGVALLGGRITTALLEYPLGVAPSEFLVQLDGLSLGEVLALEGEDISGEGVLDGTLPVRIDAAGITMTDGRVVARAPGGKLRYRGAVSSGARSTPGLGLALEALSDFSYTRLEADADYAADGVLSLQVRLEGRSSAVEQGRPIHFNLNVSENVLTLLRALRVSSEVTERVQEKFSR